MHALHRFRWVICLCGLAALPWQPSASAVAEDELAGPTAVATSAAAASEWWAFQGGKRPLYDGRAGHERRENPVHVHDLHVTILDLPGINHEQLTDRYGARDFRRTDVHGNVIHHILR